MISEETYKITESYRKMMVTGLTIKKLRLEAELTQRELAELAGVSQAHIAKIERRRVDPRLSTINKILQVLAEGKDSLRHLLALLQR